MRGKGKGRHPERPRAIKLIVFYKFAKCAAELLFAIFLFRFISGEESGPLLIAARFSRRHVVSMLSLFAAKWVFRMRPPQLYYTTLALALDAAISCVEGASLYEGFSWAPLFIVAVTGLPLPLELVEIIRNPHIGRVIFFLTNMIIVLYLGRRASFPWAVFTRGS